MTQSFNSSGTPNASYFDEAYFERGWERGTAYSNYLQSAADSRIFQTVAKAMCTAFAPSKALEIGCATGAIVAHVNAAGVEGHGIDVSEWAVSKAMHPNVKLASASELPYADASFDLVYSSHALEHLPEHIYEAAFREIDRVCGPDAIQFHMLPIVGTYPYDYDESTVLHNLRADPTHVLLKSKAWWLEQWDALGWQAVPANLLLPDDTDNVELSSGQFCLVRNGSDVGHGAARRINQWNVVAFRELLLERQKKASNQWHVTPISSECRPSTELESDEGSWVDLKHILATSSDFTDAVFNGYVENDSDTSVSLRIALVSQTGDVVEKWLTFEPGTSVVKIELCDFDVEHGSGSTSDILQIFFGGEIGKSKVVANLSVRGPHVVINGLFD